MIRLFVALLFLSFSAAAGPCDGFGVSASDPGLECWESRYIRDYRSSAADLMSKYAGYSALADADTLRREGITPEKAEYLLEHFVADGETGALANAMERAAQEFLDHKAEFKFALKAPLPGYPRHLQPIGVVGLALVNPFGEAVACIMKDRNSEFLGALPIHSLAADGSCSKNASDQVGKINTMIIVGHPFLTDMTEVKKKGACRTCLIFEIAFNSMSRTALVLYDKLSAPALGAMAIGFLIWSLFLFWNKVIEGGKPVDFVREFFSKSVWLAIVAGLLSVSVKDENNLLKWTLEPMTGLMASFAEKTTEGISPGKAWECSYVPSDKYGDKVLFSAETKRNILCAIERLDDFVRFSSAVGRYNMKRGAAKMVVGLLVVVLFLYIGLVVPYYFIESIFKIGLVVILLPLVLIGLALDKLKSMPDLAYKTLMGAVFQVISLSIVLPIIAVLMLYAGGVDYYAFSRAGSVAQAQAGSMIWLLSMDATDIKGVLFTGLVSLLLLGKAVSIANKFGGGDNMPKQFFRFIKGALIYIAGKTHSIELMRNKADAIQKKMEK
ncbi:MAG: hypothetical protein LBT92_02430 [Rickettsiales bacterium]|jgi:hypothetical protein|nr:hypothetical protein [Rickettsiales bacterium]